MWLLLFIALHADPRACVLPSSSLRSSADTAAYCGNEFIVRNGYTDALGSSDRDAIAVESVDRGHTLQEALEFRRNTIARGARSVCTTAGGYLVVFRSGDAREVTFGRAVQMNAHFGALQVLTYGVRLADIDSRSTCVGQ